MLSLKRNLQVAIVTAVISVVSVSAFAHQGKTNSKECHNNYKTGVYHCH